MSTIDQQFDRLIELGDRYEAISDDISAWSVGRHVFHLALSGSSLAVSLITGRLWDGVPSAPALKDHILRNGTIPHGRAEAPESVRPAPDPTRDEIVQAIGKCRSRVARIPSAAVDARMIHPYLGTLTRDELLVFIAIHNRHHLTIIDRILASG
ncbi:MAG: DinB family protein [Rhodothermales bacterium]|nr:DinB family protein [Rhodothermales bacterium]